MHIDDLFNEPLMITRAGVILYMLSNQVASEEPGAQALSEFENGLTIAQENEVLKADLARRETGWRPSSADLAAAPELQDWRIGGLEDFGHRRATSQGPGQHRRAFESWCRCEQGKADDHVTYIGERHRAHLDPRPTGVLQAGRRALACFQLK